MKGIKAKDDEKESESDRRIFGLFPVEILDSKIHFEPGTSLLFNDLERVQNIVVDPFY